MDLKTYITDSQRGAATKLAIDIGISSSYLSQLANGDAAISPQRAVAIEQATNGKVGRKDLRPDDWESIWPELASSEPTEEPTRDLSTTRQLPDPEKVNS